MTLFFMFSYKADLFTKGLEWFILCAFGIHTFIYFILSIPHIMIDLAEQDRQSKKEKA